MFLYSFIHSFIHSLVCLFMYLSIYLFIYLFISLYKSDGDAEAGRPMWVWLKLSPKVDFCLVSARAFFCKFLYAQY